MGNILPTHACFDNALDLLTALVADDQSRAYTREFILVHAICEAPTGLRYAHAFVERNDVSVIFAGIMDGTLQYFITPKADYYRETGVRETTKYTIREATYQNIQHNNFGPWEERFRVLCGDEKRIMAITTGYTRGMVTI